jgi:hypothetical protein
MSYSSNVVNNRTMNGIISYDDGNGGILEDGVMTATKMVCPMSEMDVMIVNNLVINDFVEVDGVNITATWMSYLYGLTSNIQDQINNMIANHLSGNNTWTGFNTYTQLVTMSSLYVSGAITGSTITQINNDIALKAPINNPTFTGSVSGITKSMVGLGNVDNTSDVNKPISSLTQSALTLKANLVSPTFSGTVSGITKSMVGLGNVDNTSDVNKPISSLTQTALDLKLNSTGGTLISGIARFLYLYNMGGSAPSFPGNTFGTICSNYSSGQGEVDIISSGYSYPSARNCAWYTLDLSGNSVLLMYLTKAGNLIMNSVSGTITSPNLSSTNSTTTNLTLGTYNVTPQLKGLNSFTSIPMSSNTLVS